ncbi:MAG: hypothetical protein QM503_02920 [Bacteroidota bacterium]
MKKYNNIDDFIKEQVSDFQVTPTDNVWQNIESGFLKTNKSNNRNKILWALASILLIIGSIFTWKIVNNDTKQNNLVITTNNDNYINDINNTIEINEIETNIKSEYSNDELIITEDKIRSNKSDIGSITTNTSNSGNESAIINNTYNYNISTNNSSQDNIPITNELISFSIVSITPKRVSEIENVNTPSIINDFKKVSIEEYMKKRKNLHFYTGASASIAMTYYSASTDQMTWSADLIYGLKVKDYYIESGVGFQKMKEEGLFQIDYKTNDSVGYYNKVVSFEVDPNNPNSITYKTQTTTVFDSIEHHLLKSPLYTYDYVTIPIKFGYKFYQRDQFSVSAETGIIYSLLTKTYIPNVSYSDSKSQLIGISNNTPDRVEHNFRIHVALRLNYNITKTISLSAQPEFTSYINSIYKQPNNYQTKPYTMGIRFGILFDF